MVRKDVAGSEVGAMMVGQSRMEERTAGEVKGSGKTREVWEEMGGEGCREGQSGEKGIVVEAYDREGMGIWEGEGGPFIKKSLERGRREALEGQ